MRRNVARIGLVAVLALSMGTATATAPPARANEPTSLVSPARSSAGLMNYAINLSPGSSPADLERALAQVPGANGAALASYAQIGTFFAQSESASFAPDLAEALRAPGSQCTRLDRPAWPPCPRASASRWLTQVRIPRRSPRRSPRNLETPRARAALSRAATPAACTALAARR